MIKKILIVTDNLPDQINGVVTTYKNIEAFAFMDGYSIDYIDPSGHRHFNLPFYNEVKISIPWEMGKKIQQIRPDYIHIATEGPLGLSARRFLAIHGISYNTAYHTKFPEGLKKLLGIPENMSWPFIRWFHSNSNKVLTTTDSMVMELRSKGFGENVIGWTRGVNREVFNASYRKENNKEKVLLSVGRVSKEKNLDEFCSLKIPNTRKILVGDGPYTNELEEKYDDVEFVGYKRGSELAEYYANADVFVFTSRWDTFGIVMIESMACGTPVAAYPVQGPLDVIDQNVTGHMNENLELAVIRALEIDRDVVIKESEKWTWENAWEIFRDNLVEAKLKFEV